MALNDFNIKNSKISTVVKDQSSSNSQFNNKDLDLFNELINEAHRNIRNAKALKYSFDFEKIIPLEEGICKNTSCSFDEFSKYNKAEKKVDENIDLNDYAIDSIDCIDFSISQKLNSKRRKSFSKIRLISKSLISSDSTIDA